MKVAALIPARGGSKRLLRKNILELAGRPMLAHPLLAAYKSTLFDCIYVSTEDKEISKIAKKYDAKVIERPNHLAKDRSTVVDVCIHALETHPEIDILCCLYATAVLLTPESIVSGYQRLINEPNTDFVMGVSEYEHHPVQALKFDGDGYLSYMWEEWKGIQSQFYPYSVVSNGTFYWVRREPFLKERTFYGRKLRAYVVPKSEVSDINTQEDLNDISSAFIG